MTVTVVSTSLVNAGTGSNQGDPLGGHTTSPAWTSPGNISADDGVLATVSLSTAQRNWYSQTLRGTNYGFAIPLTATIVGITASINRYRTGTDNDVINSIPREENSLIHPSLGFVGSFVGAGGSNENWATPIGTTITQGTSTDPWGVAWTPELINDSTFGYALRAGRGAVAGGGSNTITANVDYIATQIHYIPEPLFTMTRSAGIAADQGANWTNPNNIIASDGSFATTSSTASSFLRATSFGFELPDDAIPYRIDVEVDCRASGTFSKLQIVQLVKNNTATGSSTENTDLQTAFTSVANRGVIRRLTTSTETWGYCYGANNSTFSLLWNTSWTASEINNSGFGCQFRALNNGGSQTQIDNVRIKVYYQSESESAAAALRHKMIISGGRYFLGGGSIVVGG